MMMLLSIALGGALGAVGRYGVSMLAVSIWGASIQPVATLFVNGLGSGLMGVGYGLLTAGLISESLRGLVMVGFLGALTTFSAFAFDAVALVEKGFYVLAAGYVLASVVISLFGFALMLWITRSLLGGISGF